MMTREETKELLEKQLQLLSEQSNKINASGMPNTTRELCDMTNEMCKIAELLIGTSVQGFGEF